MSENRKDVHVFAKNYGYEPVETGGGCTALKKTFPGERSVFLAAEENRVPNTLAEPVSILFQGDDMEEYANVEGTFTLGEAIALVNKVTQQGWPNEDLDREGNPLAGCPAP